MSGERTHLPVDLTAGVQEAFASLPPDPTPEQVNAILQSTESEGLVGQTIADIRALDSCFAPSGPGGFYRSDVARGEAGRLKLHVFPSLEICDGDTGPHSHSTEVMSLVFAGTVRNTVYDFSPDEDGDIQAERFQGPAHLSRKVVPVGLGRLSMVSDQEVSGNVYRVAHGEIHTSQTIGDYAVTLCFFGRPKEVPGTRYEPRGVVEQPEDRRSMLLRPKDIIS